VRNEGVVDSQAGKEYPAENTKKEGELDWSYLERELPSNT